MAPKKGQKMSLNAFLEDSTLGSWADEMDALPSAPAQRAEGDDGRNNRLGGRAAEGGFRNDRPSFPPREDLPLPTQPPFTAFVGNLAFDLTESELGDYFTPLRVKSVKIIKDREDKPKGFGYVEFESVDDLKEALGKSGSNMAGRTIRLSVAEPPKERSGFGGSGGFDDDSKHAGPWRREGPLPDLPGRDRDATRRRFDGPSGERAPPPPSVSDTVDQWRSNRPSPRVPSRDLDLPNAERKQSGFRFSSEPGRADTEETWSKGSKFRPTDESSGSRFGPPRERNDMGPPTRDPPPHSQADEEVNWRAARPARLSNNTSPTGSTPPTPQMGRRKLELLPRSGTSASPSPLSSPRIASSNSGPNTPRANPFGDAKPVDVSAKDRAITERVEKEREAIKDKVAQPHSMSRTSSRTGVERTTSKPGTTRPPITAGANVRPAVSFASALGGSAKEDEKKEEVAAASPTADA